jgi:endonuclease III
MPGLSLPFTNSLNITKLQVFHESINFAGQMEITQIIIGWYDENKRDLPWRKTSDPYKIWLSEIILQQTRIDQGLDYYTRFVDRFATLFDLANASEEEVLKLWQGLGYYSPREIFILQPKSLQILLMAYSLILMTGCCN